MKIFYISFSCRDNRVPVRNGASEHRSNRDESLPIVSDELFEAAKSKLGTRKRSTVGPARSADLIRTFTGHLFCGYCNSAKSSNAIYYQCW